MTAWFLAFFAMAFLAGLCGMALGLARVATGVFLVPSGVSPFGARAVSR